MEKQATSAVTWTFLDNLHEGVILTNPEGKLVFVNQAAKTLLGLNSKNLKQTNFYQVVADTESHKQLLDAPAQSWLRTKDGRILEAHSRLVSLDDGQYIQILLNPLVETGTTATIEQLAALTRISNEPDFNRKLQLIVDGLRATGWNRVVLTLRDANFNPTHIITSGFTPEEQEFLKNNLLPAKAWLDLFNDEEFQKFRRGACYFVPGDSTWAQENLGSTILPDNTATGKDPEAWHPKDVLCIPLLDRQKRRIGLLGLDQPTNGRRPSPAALQTIELYAQFAAAAIENSQLVNETLARSRELETLFEASNALSGTLEPDTIFHILAEHMLKAINGRYIIISQWHPQNNTLTILTSNTPHPLTNTTIHLTEGNLLHNTLTTLQPITQQLTSDSLPTHHTNWLEKKDHTYIIIPLTLSDEPFALIEIFIPEHRPIESRELQLLTALANQASAALENALIFEDTYDRERFYNALGNVNLAINYTLDLSNVLNLICSESMGLFNVDGAYIWLLEEDSVVGSAAKGHGDKEFIGTKIPLTDNAAFVNHIIQSGQAQYINHIQENKQIELRLPQKESIQAVLGVPLEQEGNIIGILVLVDNHHPDRFTEKDVSRAAIFGVQTSIAVQNAKLFAELRTLNEELDLRVAERTRALHEESNRVKILLRITTELSASLDHDRVLHQALHLVNEVANATQGVILLIDQETGELVFRSAFGTNRDLSSESGVPSGLMRHEGLAGWMISHRESVIVHDTLQDERWVQRETSANIRSVLGVPLITSEEVIGVLMLFHTEPNAFTQQQLDLVEAAAVQVANAISNANLFLLIRDQAERLGSLLRSAQIESAKSQAILESIADGVIVADEHSKIILANISASNILEIPRQQLLGKSVNELLGLYGHSGDAWIKTIEDWSKHADRLEQGTFLSDQLEVENKVISVHLSPVLSGKQFFGTVSIFRDITKEVEVDKLKSEFVSTVSHELRTPMTSIKGYADLMLMGAAGPMSEAQSRYLKVIKNNADRLHMLVNDLLNISRIETGKISLDLRPLDVPQLIEQIVEGHLRGRIQHEQKQLQVKTDIAPALPLVNADHARVTQILTNLLDNAFNYTPEGGQICIRARAKGQFVYISVEDTGIGIAKENLNKIFDRFFRAEDEAVQRVPGTGLGLAIVRSLIEMHGGKLSVESTVGKGSTFTFTLPVVVEDSDPT
ncbi:MAG: GAF domain-containing protein [Chloroflexi bacterium]|nr:MAG: GAF domain-containing protein [Chloroflexota bacterium]